MCIPTIGILLASVVLSVASLPCRVTLAKCLREVLTIDDPGVEDFSATLLQLMTDESYHVRKYVSCAITLFFTMFENQRQIYNDLAGTLLPISKFSSSVLCQHFLSLLIYPNR